MNSPAEIARLYVDSGTQKSMLPPSKMFVMGILAGMFIAMGGFASSVASYGISEPGLARLLSAAVFPVGLMLVLVAGAELFTGNNLMIMPVMQKRITVPAMLKNWGIVYCGNFIGSVFIAWIVTASTGSALYDGALMQTMANTAHAKVDIGFVDAIMRGIMCNLMVCLAVWVSIAAADLAGKIMALYLPVFLFVLCGFEHCIANMYFIPAGIFAGWMGKMTPEGLNWLTFVYRNLIPVTIGNVIGGSVLTGGAYWFVYLQGHAE